MLSHVIASVFMAAIQVAPWGAAGKSYDHFAKGEREELVIATGRVVRISVAH